MVDYDRMVDDPRGQLQRIADTLALPFEPEGPELTRYRDSFVDESLRHSRHDREDDALAKIAPASVVDLCRVLNELAADSAGFDDTNVTKAMDNIRANLKTCTPRFIACMRTRSGRQYWVIGSPSGISKYPN